MSTEFHQLIEQYQNLVMALIRRYYGGRLGEQAEDLAQQVWVKLWERFKKNENNIVNFKSYLYRTVQTTLWDAIRSLDQVEGAELPEVESVGASSDEERVHAQLAVEQLLTSLSPEESQMMRAYLKGFTNQEISVLLGCSEGRVRNLLTRIKKKLAKRG